MDLRLSSLTEFGYYAPEFVFLTNLSVLESNVFNITEKKKIRAYREKPLFENVRNKVQRKWKSEIRKRELKKC